MSTTSIHLAARPLARVTLTALGLWLLLAVLTPVQAGWEVREVDGQQFVTLRTFCEFYDLPYRDPGDVKDFETKNSKFHIKFNGDSRIAEINNIRHWMCFEAMKVENEDSGDMEWLISKVDLIKLFEPIMRPHLIKDRTPVKGVVLDPGHGGSDKGAVSRRGKREKDYALDLAFRIEKILRSHGINVVMTRRTDTFVGLHERTKRAAKYKDYIFVSLHFNAAHSRAKGLETFACTPPGAPSQSSKKLRRSDFERQNGNDADRRNILLAHEIQNEIMRIYDHKEDLDRGVKRARFVVLRTAEQPAVLVEGGFLSNRWESGLVERASHRQKLAQLISNGIRNYMALMEPRLPSKPLTSGQPTIISQAPPISGGGESDSPAGQKDPPTVIYPATSSRPSGGSP
ncbi:MAG: N-acetylmuramoyl-L-alanine amidase [Verrucomicrobiota bacterium]